MSKTKTNSHQIAPQIKPDYRIGDLLWCREKNGKVWWPAMVTYDPNLGVYYRMKPPYQILCYHVQYFGISAIRGWVSSKVIEPISDPIVEKDLPQKGLSQKLRSEYQVAMKEVREAASLDYKERKLRFIFSFDPPPRSKKARNDSTTSRSSLSADQAKNGMSGTKATPRTSVKVENAKASTATRKMSSSSTVPESSKDTQNGGGVQSLQGDGSSSRRNSESGNRRSRTSSRRKRSASEKASEQERVHSSRNRLSCSKEEQRNVCDDDKQTSSGEYPFSLACGDIILQDVKKLRCTSPPVEAKSLNLDSELNDSAITVELCEQQQQIQAQPQPAFYFQPTFAPLGGLPYQTPGACMYMSVQYASLWPSATGMAASTPTLGQSPQMYGGLNMLYMDPQRQLLGDRLHNSRMLPFHSPTPSLFPQNSYTTPTLLAPPTAPPSAVGASLSSIESSPSIVPLSPTPTRVTTSQSSSPSPVISEETPSVMSSLKRPRRSNVRYGSTNLTRQSSGASSMDAGESAVPERRALRSCNGKARVEPVTRDPVSMATSDNNIRITDTSQAITSALLTPPTSSSEDSPSIDVEREEKPTPSLTLSFPLPISVLSSEHTASSSEDTDTCSSSTKLETGRKRKREHKSVTERDETTFKSGTCSICDEDDSDLLVCGGHCSGMFHLDCLGLMQTPNFKFVCDECLFSSSKCFACGKSNGEVIKCSKSRCSKLYHLSCIEGNRLFTFDGKRPSNFTCPLHVCARCESIGGRSHVSHSNLLQCTMCPLALHKPDCCIAGCEVVSQTHMVCYQHMKITKNAQLYSHLNLNTCLECGLIGSLFCCDVCSAAYHLECLDEPDRPFDDVESWKCPSCAVHDLPTYGSLVLCKFGVWRWVFSE